MNRLLFILLPLNLLAQGPDSAAVKIVVAHRLFNEDYLYKGIPNPIDIAVPGVECSAFEVSVTRGRIEGSGCSYTIEPDTSEGSWALFLDLSWQNGTQLLTASHEFWVRNVPAPIAKFAGRSFQDDTIKVKEAKTGMGLVLLFQDERLNDIGYRYPRFRVDHFQLTILRKCETIFDEVSHGDALSASMREAMQHVQENDVILFSDISYVTDEGPLQVAAPIRVIAQ